MILHNILIRVNTHDVYDLSTKVNAGIIQSIARGIAANCPNAMVCVITNPVNSTVPIVAETLRQAGCFNPRKLVGVTTLDIQRSKAFVGAHLGVDPQVRFIN